MTLPDDPTHIKGLGYPVQPTVETRTVPHQVFHIVNPSTKEDSDEFEELAQLARQDSLSQHLDQVSEVVRAVEGDPLDEVVAHEPRRHHQLGEPDRLNAELAVPLEVDPLAPQQLDRVVRVGVTRHVEVVEVELPYVKLVGP